VKVWLVEDNVSLRDSLSSAIAELANVELDGSFALPSEALTAAREGRHFDVGLIDLGLPEMSGASLIAELARRVPGAALIALTVRSDDEAIFGALRAGAVGYLLKDASIDFIAASLDMAVSGGSPLSPGIARRVVRQFQPARSDGNGFGLTPREGEVLQSLCSGASYREVARELGISEGTVQTHVKNVYEKLGVSSKAEAVRIAFESCLVTFGTRGP
jgi:DNA-binding NarL/FixJ family response regulator